MTHNPQQGSTPTRPSRLRAINGIASAVIVVLFIAHGLTRVAGGMGPSFIVWAGVAIVLVHVLLSVGTSTEMLSDTVRPPSTKKKLHLVLKWVSGTLLGAFALAHALGLVDSNKWFLCALALLIAWHAWVGSRSLLKDLRIDTRYRNMLRIILCIAAAAIAATLFTRW